MAQQSLSIGRIIHFAVHSPHPQHTPAECRPAIVTGIRTLATANVTVFSDDVDFLSSVVERYGNVIQNAPGPLIPGHWHWREDCAGHLASAIAPGVVPGGLTPPNE